MNKEAKQLQTKDETNYNLDLLVENSALSIKLEQQIAGIKAQESALKATKKALQTQLETLNKNLTDHLLLNKLDEYVVRDDYLIKLRKNPPSVVINNEDLITDEYRRKKEVITIDKAKIKSDLSNDKPVAGANLNSSYRVEVTQLLTGEEND